MPLIPENSKSLEAKNPPLLSVCIVSSNLIRLPFLLEAIQSVMHQISDFPNQQELVVLAPERSTTQITERWATGAMTLIASNPKSSLHENRREALRASSGKYVMFVDDDDLLTSDSLALVLWGLGRDEKPDILESPKRIWNSFSNSPGQLLSERTLLPDGPVDPSVFQGRPALSVTIPGRVFRKSLLEGCFQHEWNFPHEDVLEFFLVLAQKPVVRRLEREIYLYRKGHRSLTSRRKPEQARLFAAALGIAARIVLSRDGLSPRYSGLKSAIETVSSRAGFGVVAPRAMRRVTRAAFLGADTTSPDLGRVAAEMVGYRENSVDFPEKSKGEVAHKILFVCLAEYHIQAASEVIQNSRNPDLYAVLDLTQSHAPLRRARPDLMESLAGFLVDVSLATILQQVTSLTALICFNDHHPDVRTLLQHARFNGVVTLSWVEGIYDFSGFTVGGIRGERQAIAYRVADWTIVPSDPVRQQIGRDSCVVVPNPFLVGLRQARAKTRGTRIVINYNFVGSQLKSGTAFLNSVAQATHSAGLSFEVSVHPGVTQYPEDFRRFVSPLPLEEQLGSAGALVSPFSNALAMAAALGCHPILFSPFAEKIRPLLLGATDVSFARTTVELARALRLNPGGRGAVDAKSSKTLFAIFGGSGELEEGVERLENHILALTRGANRAVLPTETKTRRSVRVIWSLETFLKKHAPGTSAALLSIAPLRHTIRQIKSLIN